MQLESMDPKKRALLESHGYTMELPEGPEFPADRVAYAVTDGDTSDEDGMAFIEGIHQLYNNEKDRLAAAYEGREQARKEREAYLKANPPQPQDGKLRFWTGRRPKRTEQPQTGGATR